MATAKDLLREYQLSLFPGKTAKSELFGPKGFNSDSVAAATKRGFSANDINEFLKISGVKPTGSGFALGGMDGGGRQFSSPGRSRFDTQRTGAFYTMTGPINVNTSSSNQSSQGQGDSGQSGVSDPSAPMFQERIPGVNTLLRADAPVLRGAKSKARRNRMLNSGTSRLTIPRSSGASGLNI